MKLFKNYSGIDFATVENGFADFPGYNGLPWRRRMRLALLLIDSRVSFDLRHIEETPTKSADAIKGILQSIKRIADFAANTDPAMQDAMHSIYGEADTQIESNQGSAVVSGFFNSASVIYRIAKEAERSVRNRRGSQREAGAMSWLVGAKLPEVYSTIFRSPFTTTASKPANENLGIAFVRRGLAVLKVRDDMPEETILTHVKNCRRADGG